MREGMRLVACTILLVLLISGCGGSQGTSESSNSRIINGAKLETPELTGVVSVQMASLTAPGQYCTASVIGTRHLLTAAHCVPQGEYLYGVVNLPDRNVPLAMIPYETLPCGGSRIDKFCFDGMSEHFGSRWDTGSADLLQPKFLAWSLSPKACILKGAVESAVGSGSPPTFGGTPMCS